MKTLGPELENRAGEERRGEGGEKRGTRYDPTPLLDLKRASVFSICEQANISKNLHKP